MSWFYASISLCFINAITSLGVVAYLLALIRNPETVKHQYYVYSTNSLNELWPMSILPGWVLKRGLRLSVVTSAIAILDVPVMVVLWRRVHTETTDNMVDRQRLKALCLVSLMNSIMGIVALSYTYRDDRRYVDPDSRHDWLYMDAPTSGPYNQFTSSVGVTIKTFSCGLTEAALHPRDQFASHLCRVTDIPFELLMVHTVMSAASLHKVSQVIERVQQAGETKSESDGIICSEIEMQSERADEQGRAQADNSSCHEDSTR